MLIINQRRFLNKLTVKQSSGLTTVGTIADEDLESAASSLASTRFVSDPVCSAGSDPSVESEQKNLRKKYGLLLFCPRITRRSGDVGSPMGTRRLRWTPNAACALHRVVRVFNIEITQIWIRVFGVMLQFGLQVRVNWKHHYRVTSSGFAWGRRSRLLWSFFLLISVFGLSPT